LLSPFIAAREGRRMEEGLYKRVSELQERLRRGEISRRELLRYTSLLGLSLGAAEALAACVPKPTPRPTLPAPTPAPIPAAPLERQEGVWQCLVCGERFDSAEALKGHMAAEHARKLPEIRRVSEPTYSRFLVGEVKRFDQKNIIFARAVWDEEYKERLREARKRAMKRSKAEELEGRALVAGAIHVDAAAGSFHPKYPGYFGHLKGVGGLYSWDEPVNPTKLPVSDPAQMSEHIKRVARLYGADLVGICEVDQRWVYSHYFDIQTGAYGELDLSYKYAIVMAIKLDWKMLAKSPGFEASAAAALGYSRMAELTSSLAKYIRSLGYPAVPSGNDTAQSIPLAIDAGLGELGRNGLLITPQFGPQQRLCKVFTDLPLKPDQPIDFGIQSLCEECEICARACPARAIKFGERTVEPTSISNRRGILRWPVDVEKCYQFWQENGTDCSNCIAVCPMGLVGEWYRMYPW